MSSDAGDADDNSDLTCPTCIAAGLQPMSRYHRDSVRNQWGQPRSGDWGIEIELQTSSRGAVSKIAHDHFFAAEKDSSLPETSGIELISAPTKYNALCMGVESLLAEIGADTESKAWDGDSGYSFGIHISFHTGSIPLLSLMKFVMFINRNAMGICELVAGRDNSEEYARFDPYASSRASRCSFSRRVYNPDKYCAVNLVGRRCEVRIFRSTLNPESVLAYMEFIQSAREFAAREFSPMMSDLAIAKRYIKFLTSEKLYKYPNLVKLLLSRSDLRRNRKRRSELVGIIHDVLDREKLDRDARLREPLKEPNKSVTLCS